MSAEELVTLAGVGFGYDGRPVLDGVDLTIGPRDLLAVVGPSGAGKTTLLRVVLGTVAPQRGTVHRSPDTRVGYVPQLETVNWDFPVTVAECVLMSRKQRLWPWPTREERAAVAHVLDRLGIGDLGERHIRELSGGQQQRMFIARALLRDPQLLLLDEPTSGVDVATRHSMLHLLAELNESGVAVLLTTHDLNGVATHLPRVVALNVTVVADGPPADVIHGSVLEQTFGAPMEVMQHLGMPVVLDNWARDVSA